MPFLIFDRMACWTCVLNGVLLAFHLEMPCVMAPFPCDFDLPVPCDNVVWRTRSAHEWMTAGGSRQMRQRPTLWKTVKTLLLGQSISGNFSSFALLSLIGGLLAHICGRERLELEILDEFESDFVRRIEKSLAIWEILWRRHPDAEQVPTRRGDPLLADCFPLLGSAHYHLYVGKELRILKSIARDLNSTVPLPKLRANGSVLKAVKYAANSWHVRAKIGMEHLKRTAALEYGGHVTVTAFEGGKFLPSSFPNSFCSMPREKPYCQV